MDQVKKTLREQNTKVYQDVKYTEGSPKEIWELKTQWKGNFDCKNLEADLG